MVRHPIALICLGFQFGILAVDSLLRSGFSSWFSYLMLTVCLLAIHGGMYFWLRWFNGKASLVAFTTAAIGVVAFLLQLNGPGFGLTERERVLQSWIRAEERAREEVSSRPPEVQRAFYFVKQAEIALMVLKNKKDARWELELAIKAALEHQIGGVGRFGMFIPAELQQLIPETNFFQTRGGTLVQGPFVSSD